MQACRSCREARSRHAPAPGSRAAASDSGVDLAGREVLRLHKQVLESPQPPSVVAREVDIARQFLHGEAANVEVAAEQR
jgi:hypothetical protein